MASALSYSLSLSTSAFTGPLKAAQGALGSFTGAAASTGAAVARIAAPLAAIAGPLALAGAGFKAFQKAADFESIEVGFKTILGDAGKAKDLLQEIAREAKSTPYGIVELAQATRSLMAVADGQNLIPTLRMIGDLASAAQRPITDLAAMYAKIKGSDSVQGEDLNQISDALPGSLQEFVKVLGVDSVAAVRKLGEQGRISGAALDQVFINLTSEGGKAFNAMAAQSETTNGLISTLKDNVDALFVTFGKPITDFLKPILTQNIVRLEEMNSKVAAFFRLLTEAKKQGNLGALLGASLNLAFIDAVNTLSGGIRGVVAYVGSALPKIFQTAVDELTSERSTIFFSSLFSSLGEILQSKLERGASAIAKAFGAKGVAMELETASIRSGTRSSQYMDVAQAALSTADLGKAAEAAAKALRDADKAGRDAAEKAKGNPLLDRKDALDRFQREAVKASFDAAVEFSNPVKEAGKEAAKLTGNFKGLNDVAEKTKAAQPQKAEERFPVFQPGNQARPGETLRERIRREREERTKLLNENSGRNYINKGRAAAEELRRGAAAAALKPARNDKRDEMARTVDPILKEVREIKEQFTKLATA